MRTRRKSINKDQLKPSLVSPILASVFSAIIPGLGQILARKSKRGLTIFASMVTSFGLLIWRIFNASQRYDGLQLKIYKAYSLNPILYLISIVLILSYILML